MDTTLLTKKIKQLEESLAELKDLCREEVSEILINYKGYRTAERLFQLIVDTCVDINVHLIRERVGKAPDDLQSTFIALGEAGILDLTFATKIAPVVGLRNRIVHRYDTLDRRTFIETVKKERVDFDTYLEKISAFVKNK